LKKSVPRSPGFLVVVSSLVLLTLSLLLLATVRAGMRDPLWPWDWETGASRGRVLQDGVADLGLHGIALGALAVLVSFAIGWSAERHRVAVRRLWLIDAKGSATAWRRAWLWALLGPRALTLLALLSLGVAVAAGIQALGSMWLEIRKLGPNTTPMDLAKWLSLQSGAGPCGAVLAGLALVASAIARLALGRAVRLGPPEPVAPETPAEDAT
jgi:hypothetical protein